MIIFSRFTWWAGAMVGFAILLSVAGRFGVLDPFQGAFLTVSSPFERALTTIFQPAASFLDDIRDIGSIRAENRDLLAENERLRNDLLEREQAVARVEELELALGIVQGTDVELVAANVVIRDRAPGRDRLRIDVGSGDEVRVGNVVLSPQGSLVGTIIEVTGGQAFVRVITDSQSAVNAQVTGGQTSGQVRGTQDRRITLALADGEVNVGDNIQTSGLGGGYPPGIPIGTVTAISGTSQDLFQTIDLEPGVRISTVTTVLVNTTFVPSRAGIGN